MARSPVCAGHAGAQMRESLGEADVIIHLQQEVGDPGIGQTGIEIKHHGFGV